MITFDIVAIPTNDLGEPYTDDDASAEVIRRWVSTDTDAADPISTYKNYMKSALTDKVRLQMPPPNHDLVSERDGRPTSRPFDP